MNIFRKIKASLRYKEAVRKAEKAHTETGERYYVLPMGNESKLMIMDRKNFRKLKFKGYMSRDLHITNLEKECFYCTSYRNGNDRLPPQVRRQYRRAWVFQEASESVWSFPEPASLSLFRSL